MASTSISTKAGRKKSVYRKSAYRKKNRYLERNRKRDANLKQFSSMTKHPGLDKLLDTSKLTCYYSIYRGWSVNYSACFLNPVYALIWMRWMFWKDMVLHFWHGENSTPRWHTCVGVAKFDASDLVPIVKEKGIWGKLTRQLFDGIKIMKFTGHRVSNNRLLSCSDEDFRKCLSFFKKHADYQQSAGSIFDAGCNIVTLSKKIDIENWIPVIARDLSVCEYITDYKLIDIASSARNRLKSKKNERSGGMFKVIICSVIHNMDKH